MLLRLTADQSLYYLDADQSLYYLDADQSLYYLDETCYDYIILFVLSIRHLFQFFESL